MPTRQRRPATPTAPLKMRRRPQSSPATLNNGQPTGTYDGPTDENGRTSQARFLATGGKLIPRIYRRNPGACLILLYKAQALNIPIAVALDNLHWNPAVGKGALSAQLMAALLHRAGYRFTTTEETPDRVAMTFHGPAGGRLGDVDWTILEAVAAGLTLRDQWQAYPKDMLWARCIMRGARRYASTVGTGMAYTPEELGDQTDTVHADVPAAVQEFLDQATSASATADLIKDDITARARRAKLINADAGGGLTLGEALADLYGATRAREVDIINASTAHPTAAGDNRPAGVGDLDCGCPAREVLMSGAHRIGCPA